MQQQAALVAAASHTPTGPAYINMAALAAAGVPQISPLAAVPNGLTTATITPTTSGKYT